MTSPLIQRLRGIPEWGWVVLALLAALALRLANLNATSVWMDELYSLMVANGHIPPAVLKPAIIPAGQYYQQHLAWQPMDFHRLLAALKINVHMPLYYLLLNPWLGWLGNDAIGLRSFSALCSTLMLVPIYLLGKTLGGTHKRGILALTVAALVPFQIYYGQEGRMYALSLLWCAISALAFWKTLYAPKPLGWSLLYALSVTAGLSTHYMFVFYLVFQVVYAVLWLIQSKNIKRFSLFGFALAALVALGWAWLPIYRIQQQGINEDYHFAKGWLGWLRYVTALVWQPLVVIAGDNRLERVFYMPVTVLLSLSMLFKAKYASKPSPLRFFQREGFLLLWIFIPLLAQIGYDVLQHTHTTVIDRYVMLISPAMCLWLALAIARLPAVLGHKAKPVQASLLGLMLVLAIGNVWQPSPFRDEHNKDNNLRAQFQYMTQQARPDDLVVANGPWGASLLAAYYLNQQRPDQPMIYWINRHLGQTVPLPDSAMRAPYHRAWLFRNRANNERGLQQIKDYLQAGYPNHARGHDWFIYWNPAFSPMPVP